MEPRPYLEAYPRITVSDALRQWRAGRSLCSWRDPARHVVGTAVVDWHSTSEVVVTYDVGELPCLYSSEGVAEFAVPYHERNSRSFFDCPGCRLERQLLILTNDGWFCRMCHGLKNRTSMMSIKDRMNERSVILYSKIKHGRPRYMRDSMYKSLRAELQRIYDDAGYIGETTSSSFTYVLNSEWSKQH